MMILTASSSFGGGTFTAWKRRSRERSFSIDLRYSAGVVAPMHWISPRLSAGFDERVQLVDEDDGVLRLHQFLHDRLQPFLKLAAVLRACNDQRKVERQ